MFRLHGEIMVIYCKYFEDVFTRIMTTLSNAEAHSVNTLRPRQDGRLFPDEIFKSIFFNENVQISIKISLTFVPKGPINNIPALVQIMA